MVTAGLREVALAGDAEPDAERWSSIAIRLESTTTDKRV
jgi:hypothetical protein